MYITQEIANRIKLQAKVKKIAMKDMLPECKLNINAVSDFAKGQQLSCISLAKIADYLDCSVDYLLGRTSSPLSEREQLLLDILRELDEDKQRALLEVGKAMVDKK